VTKNKEEKGMEDKIKILIIDDNFRSLHTLSKLLSFRDYDVTPVTSGQQAIQHARDNEFDLAIVGLNKSQMPGDETLETLKAEHPFMEIIILSGHGPIDPVVKRMHSDAVSFLQEPCKTEELITVLGDAYQKRVKRKLASGDIIKRSAEEVHS